MFNQSARGAGRYRLRAFLMNLACVLAAIANASGEEPAETNQTHASASTGSIAGADLPFTELKAPDVNFFDTVQGSASSRIVSIARRVDSFFDDPEYAEEEADARASIQQSVRFYRNLDPEYRTRIRASLFLPNLDRKLRLSFEGNDELYAEDPVTAEEENLAESTRESVDTPSVRVQYRFFQHRDMDLGLSGGVRLSESAFYIGPRLKLRSDIGWGWEAKFTQRTYWYTTDNLKSKSELRLDHLLGQHNLFRQAFRTDWDEEKHAAEGFRSTATTSITQPLKKDAAMRYLWSSVYFTRPDPRWTSTTLSVGYRQSIWRKWIIVEAAPFVTWEEEFNWDPKPGVVFSFNIIFEES